MFTGSFALLHRALRLDARLVHTHLFRLGFAMLIYFSLIYAHTMSLRLGAPGLKLFESMAFLNLGLITLAGVSFFATAISEEKEEETLGLLKMAGINPLGILLGKSTSRLVGAILLLLVQFPFILLAITLGGVTLQQVFAAYCSLTAYMIFLANVGLLCSVVSRRASNASSLTVLLLLAYFLAGPLVQAVLLGLTNSGLVSSGSGWARWLEAAAGACREFSVYTRLQDIMKTNFAGSALGFQALANVGVAAICFLLAWAGFERFTRDWRSAAATAAPRSWLPRRPRGARRARPGWNPLMWKEFHFVAGGWKLQAAKLVLYGVLSAAIFVIAGLYYGFTQAQAALGVVATMGGILVLESSLYVSRLFHDEWRERTLPLLMMLPVMTPQIVYSKVIGCLPALAPAVVWAVAGGLLLPDGPAEVLKTLVLPSRWFWLLLVGLFLTLTAFFSLVVRWGALPLAIAVMLTGATFGGCCFSPVLGILMTVSGQAEGTEGAFFCVDVVVALLIAGLQFDIHRRLEIVAAQ